MSVVTIGEGSIFSQSEWIARLGLGRDDFQSLVDGKILRETDQGDYSLALVGIVVFKDRVLFARPKIGANAIFDLAGTLRILRSYFARSRRRRPVEDHYRDPEYGDSDVLREFDALMGLRDWFSAHGLYRREQARESAVGRPHWVRTIARRQPLVMQNAVIYPSIVAERREGALNDISALQASVLVRLLDRYGFPVPPEIRHAEIATGALAGPWPFTPETRAYFLRRLASEQLIVFRTTTLQLLTLLRGALDSKLAAPTMPPQIFGTTAFYSVWEDACRTGICGDVPPAVVSNIAQPTWFSVDAAGGKHVHAHSQIPDLLVGRATCLLIIDAKYYYPFPDSRPGGPDIIKQVYYAESLASAGVETRSLFLLPISGTAVPRFLGYATIEGGMRQFGEVEAWGVDPAWLFSDYPRVSASRANGVIDRILDARKNVGEFIAQAPTSIAG